MTDSPIPTNENIAQGIKAGLPHAKVAVDGDGHHFNAVVICESFAGKSRIIRHQMVYAALGERMRAEIHALSMKTLTPQEANTLSVEIN
jgi:acid stress-induced BolA-like protein IbaG/YrbA